MPKICRKYDGIAGSREWFFQSTDGHPVSTHWMTRMFRRCWKQSPGCGNTRSRPYDLRHAFATHTIMRWIDNGNDVMALMPYLSAYMGHSKISSTFYYIHLLPQRLRESAGIDWTKSTGRKTAMKKFKDPALFAHIKTYLTVYLPFTRRKSMNTVEAARYGLNLYIDYLCAAKGMEINGISTADFNADSINGFLGWIQNKRKNGATSVNQRLSQIRSFCRYLFKNDIMSQSEISRIGDISLLKDERREDFVYLSVRQMKDLLKLPDTGTKKGIRDKFFMALLYDSGARNQELLDLKVRDLSVKGIRNAELHIVGKGTKYRCTPVSVELIPLYQKYMLIYHNETDKAGDEFLFYTVRNGIRTKMSPDNVQRFLKKYEQGMRSESENTPHLHPHLFRRTRAMHLYTAGVPLPLISEWLGHSQIETTQIYARATMEMKREAVQKLGDSPCSVLNNDVTFKYADDAEAMKKLCGLLK